MLGSVNGSVGLGPCEIWQSALLQEQEDEKNAEGSGKSWKDTCTDDTVWTDGDGDSCQVLHHSGSLASRFVTAVRNRLCVLTYFNVF